MTLGKAGAAEIPEAQVRGRYLVCFLTLLSNGHVLRARAPPYSQAVSHKSAILPLQTELESGADGKISKLAPPKLQNPSGPEGSASKPLCILDQLSRTTV